MWIGRRPGLIVYFLTFSLLFKESTGIQTPQSWLPCSILPEPQYLDSHCACASDSWVTGNSDMPYSQSTTPGFTWAFAASHPGTERKDHSPLPSAHALDHMYCLTLALNFSKGTHRIFMYLSHVANGILQIQLMENIQNPISRFLSRSSHEDFAEELPIKIGPPRGQISHQHWKAGAACFTGTRARSEQVNVCQS